MKIVYRYANNGNYIESYPSIADAAFKFAVDESSIRKAIKRKQKSCGFYWSKDLRHNYFVRNTFNSVINMPKILVFDIETAPLLAAIWRLKTEYVSPNMLMETRNWWVLSWSAKWLFEDQIMHDIVTPEESLEENDDRVVLSIWKLIDEADIVISHNGINFDHKLLNMRWLLNQMMPPSPYRMIDTLKHTRSLFNFPSYKLDYLATQLGIGTKVEHEGINMWKKCIQGDVGALSSMVQYNQGDVTILEDLYLIIRPWINTHPNLGIFIESETPVCRVCGSSNLIELEGHDYTTNLSKYGTLRCECGAINKQRKSKLPLNVRKALLSGMPQ